MFQASQSSLLLVRNMGLILTCSVGPGWHDNEGDDCDLTKLMHVLDFQ